MFTILCATWPNSSLSPALPEQWSSFPRESTGGGKLSDGLGSPTQRLLMTESLASFSSRDWKCEPEQSKTDQPKFSFLRKVDSINLRDSNASLQGIVTMPTDVTSYRCKPRHGKKKKKENTFQTRESNGLWGPEVPYLGLLSRLVIPVLFATRKESCTKQGDS